MVWEVDAKRMERSRCAWAYSSSLDRSPELSWATVDPGVAALVVLLHEKRVGRHQEVQGNKVKRKGGAGGVEGDEAHRNLTSTEAEVAARRAPVRAARWRLS